MGKISLSNLVFKKLNLFYSTCFVVVFILSAISSEANKISLYIIIPFLFLYSFFQNPKLLRQFKPLLIFFFLIVWSAISTVASIDLNASIEELWLLTSVFVLSYIFVYFSTKNIHYLYLFYLLYVFYFFAILYKAYTQGISMVNIHEEGFNTVEINANLIGYLGYFAIISSFFIWKFSFKEFSFTIKKKTTLILFLITFIAAVIGPFYTASRGGITMAILTFSLYLSFAYIFPFSKKTIISLFIFLIAIYLIVPIGLDYYSDSFLKYRFEEINLQDESRMDLIYAAFETGSKNPLFGVGPGNFIFYTTSKHYSHSTYFEIFANNGIIGLSLFITLLIRYFNTNKRLFRLKGKNFKRSAWYFLIFLITFVIYNFLYVFHISLFLMSFFFLVSIHLELVVFDIERKRVFNKLNSTKTFIRN